MIRRKLGRGVQYPPKLRHADVLYSAVYINIFILTYPCARVLCPPCNSVVLLLWALGTSVPPPPPHEGS